MADSRLWWQMVILCAIVAIALFCVGQPRHQDELTGWYGSYNQHVPPSLQ